MNRANRWFVLAAVAFSFAPAGAFAAPASECDTLAVDLSARLGITTERRTDLGNFHMRHPFASEIELSCMIASTPPALTLSFDKGVPPITFYNLAMNAGALVTGADPEVVLDGVTRCQKAALRDSAGLAEMTRKGVHFDCEAHAGAETTVTISKARKN